MNQDRLSAFVIFHGSGSLPGHAFKYHPSHDGIPDVIGRAVEDFVIGAVRFPEIVVFR